MADPRPSNAKMCCACFGGPFLNVMYGKCIYCEHILCVYCEDIHIPPTKTRSVRACGTSSTGKVRSRRARNSVTRNQFAFFHSSISTIGLTHDPRHETNPDNLGPHAPRFINTSLETGHIPAASDGESIWTCCVCGEGGALVNTTPACLNCHHPRCYSCDVEEP